MGSSTRKVQQKIKKILQNQIDINKPEELDIVIPKLTIETIKMKKTRKYFGDKDFLNLLQGGVLCVQAINQKKYKEYLGLEEYIEDYVTDELATEKVLEAILDKIEEDNSIESLLMLKAFKLAMAKVLLDENRDLYNFVLEFCGNTLFLIVMENINEAMSDVYKEKNTSDYEKNVKEVAFKWVEVNIKDNINNFIDGKIKVDEFIEKLIIEINNIKDEF